MNTPKELARLVLSHHLYDDDMGGIRMACEGLIDGSISTDMMSIGIVAEDWTKRPVSVVVVTKETRFSLLSVYVIPEKRKQGIGAWAIKQALHVYVTESCPLAYQIGVDGSEVFWSKIKKSHPNFIIDELKNYY